MADCQIYELTDVTLQSGVVLPRVELAFATYGELNSARNNVVLMPTYYGGQHADTEAMIGAGRALDPQSYYIIVPNMFGPNVTVYDNVACQHRLVREHLGIDRIRLVVGFSLGAQ